ncbi:hypothetical protein EDB82DRAFT_506199 [Fusarium venenatum]|uniref:uncharacterized protein n=1 Tax=Fusarium venenatum TaxID=56646 RepID=UPI001D88F46A|nr:hypothetical protein EDB82DRAFT_506199 [Fusarium venenatum]
MYAQHNTKRNQLSVLAVPSFLFLQVVSSLVFLFLCFLFLRRHRGRSLQHVPPCETDANGNTNDPASMLGWSLELLLCFLHILYAGTWCMGRRNK